MHVLIDFPDVGATAEFDKPAERHRVHSDRQPAYWYRRAAQEAAHMITAEREQTETALEHACNIVSLDARGIAAAELPAV